MGGLDLLGVLLPVASVLVPHSQWGPHCGTGAHLCLEPALLRKCAWSLPWVCSPHTKFYVGYYTYFITMLATVRIHKKRMGGLDFLGAHLWPAC